MLLMAITSIPRLISFFSFYSEREPREQLSTTQKSLTPCVWTWDKQGNWKNPPIPVHSVNTVWLHCLIVLQSPSCIKTGSRLEVHGDSLIPRFLMSSSQGSGTRSDTAQFLDDCISKNPAKLLAHQGVQSFYSANGAFTMGGFSVMTIW